MTRCYLLLKVITFVSADFYIAWQHEFVEYGPQMNISI